MSLPPITIPDLDPAGPVDFDNDQMVIRQGLNDKRVPPAAIGNLRLQTFDPLPSNIVASDVILIGRNNGLGGYTNYIAAPYRLGFLVDNGGYPTVMWFWMTTAPLGWQIVPNSGDRVLATALPGGQSFQYTTPGYQGNWQQQDVNGVSGQGLTITQIPNHNHYAAFGHDQSNKHARYIHGARYINTDGDPIFGEAPTANPVRGVVGGKGDNANHNNYGQCDPHNHGATWRPAAAVGIICQKIQ